MSQYQTKSWADYWSLFDRLLDSLKAGNHNALVADLKEAQLYVNGLSDGWFEFQNLFEQHINRNQSLLSSQQKELAYFLVSTLKNRLW